MRKLHISPDLALPPEAVTQTFAILAKRRVGKTYTASVMAEEMIEAKLPFVVLDPTGAWWGLRASADGKSAGYPVVIIGGAHGDVPLEPTAGKVIADLVADKPGWYVLDLSWCETNADQDRFATDFALRLYRRKLKAPSPVHLFVDEADSFIPQKAQKGQERMLGAFEALIRRGGIAGIGMTMITQRPAVINKNVLTQAEVLIALQIIAAQDRQPIEDWVKAKGSKEQRDELVASLASLGRGEAWIWSPVWLDAFTRVHIRERRTFNSSATPEPGQIAAEPQVLAPVDLESLRGQIAATIEKAKADDPKELHRRIKELEREIAKAGKSVKVAPAPDPAAVERAVARASATAARERREELAEIKRRLHVVARGPFADAAGSLHELYQFVEGLQTKAADVPPVIASAEARGAVGQAAVEVARAIGASGPVHVQFARRERADKQPVEGISRPRQRILDALAAFEALGINQLSKGNVAVFSDASPKSSSFANNLGALRTSGLIDYPTDGMVALTDAGRAMAQPSESIAALDGLHEAWYAKLSGPQGRILCALITAHPEAIDRDRLAELAEASPTSSSYANNLGALRSLGLIDYTRDRGVVATDLLFPEGLR